MSVLATVFEAIIDRIVLMQRAAVPDSIASLDFAIHEQTGIYWTNTISGGASNDIWVANDILSMTLAVEMRLFIAPLTSDKPGAIEKRVREYAADTLYYFLARRNLRRDEDDNAITYLGATGATFSRYQFPTIFGSDKARKIGAMFVLNVPIEIAIEQETL